MQMTQRIKSWLAKMAGSQTLVTTGLTPLSPEMVRYFGAQSTSGKTVNDTTAMMLSAAWSCQRIISEAIGTIPWAVYTRDASGSVQRADDYPLSAVLNGSPNEDMTPVEFRETKALNLCQAGNAYSMVDRIGDQVVSLYPIRSSNVQPKRKEGGNTQLNIPEKAVFYSIKDGNIWRDYERKNVWHVKGFGNDGLTGLSPIGCARESIGFALATEEFGARFFSQGGKPSGIVTVPNFFNEDQRVIARENLQQMMSGLANAHKFALFEGGMKPEAWGDMTLEDMSFILVKQFSVLEMCRIFRVPPHMVAEVARGASYASIEQMSAEFVMFTLLPYLTRFESSASKWLIPLKDRQKYFLRFDYEALLRADSKARAEYIAAMVDHGLMSRNEGRVREGLNRSTAAGMDDYTVQTALLPIGKLGQQSVGKTPFPDSTPPAKSGDININPSITLPSALRHEVEHSHPAINSLVDGVRDLVKDNATIREEVVGLVRRSTERIAASVAESSAVVARQVADGQTQLATSLGESQKSVATALATFANQKYRLLVDVQGTPVGREPVLEGESMKPRVVT